MNLIVCLDEKGGMSFFGRRQSMDSVLRARALALAGEAGLWMNRYSAAQFSEETDRITVDEAFLENAPADAWCFLEVPEVMPVLERFNTVAVFRWNRLYPSDREFPIQRLRDGWTLSHREEFSGSSHDLITLEVYQL